MTRQVLLVAGMVIAILLLVALALPSLGLTQVAHLHGPVQVETFVDGRYDGTRTIELPGLYRNSELPPGARIRARWLVDVPEESPPGPWAIWLERPQFASRVHWDAEFAGATGDVDGAERSEASLLALLPRPDDWQGPHELMLELRGDYAAGGLIGRMVVGPQGEIVRYATLVEGERLGLVLLLASLGLVQLLVGSSPRHRSANVLFGALCLVLALYIFARSGLALSMLPEPHGSIRLRRVATAFLVPLALGTATTFDHRRAPSWIWGLLGLAGTLALAALLVPMPWLATLENVMDIGLIAGALTVPLLVVPLVIRRRPGAIALAIATIAPVMGGLFLELAVTNGLVSGTTGLLPALTTFVVGVTVALSLRDVTAGERHVALVHNSPDGMLGVDRSGRVTDANPAAQRLLGRSPLDTQLLDWVVGDDQPLLRVQLEGRPDRPLRTEIRIRGQDRVLEAVVTQLDRRTMLVVLRDVTERRAMEQSRIQRARGETMALLVGGLAHDFNNMLGTLLAHVGFLQLTTRTAPVQARLERMEATLVRASNLTRRLLNLAGGSGTPLAPTSVHDVVHAAAELVRPTLPDRVELVLDTPDILPNIAGSPSDLEHVFVNLLVNARNAVGLSGRIQVTARPFMDGDAHGVIIAVEDDGPGVPAEAHDEIFSPFVTGDGASGTGLGLAVAQQVIREHHGRIWVEDPPGGGARFCVALHDASHLDQPTEARFAAGTTIMLVEDDDDQREAALAALDGAGCTVHAFSDGTEAFEAARDMEALDALVTDFLLPGTDGIELAQRVRAKHSRVPVLLVSAHLPDRIDLSPPMVQVAKPVRVAHLLAHLHRLIDDQESSMPPTQLWPSLDALAWSSTRWNSLTPADLP